LKTRTGGFYWALLLLSLFFIACFSTETLAYDKNRTFLIEKKDIVLPQIQNPSSNDFNVMSTSEEKVRTIIIKVKDNQTINLSQFNLVAVQTPQNLLDRGIIFASIPTYLDYADTFYSVLDNEAVEYVEPNYTCQGDGVVDTILSF